MPELPLRPGFALPFTILPAEDGIHLVAGEDWRYFLAGRHLVTWLPDWLHRVDGRTPLATLLADLPSDRRGVAEAVLQRLHGERLLLNGPIEAAHVPLSAHVEILGHGPLAKALAAATPQDGSETGLSVLVQESLDYRAALEVNAHFHARGRPWFWVSSGPMTRGYVGPLFLPDVGPCLACLVSHFRRLSPAPFLYPLLETAAEIRPSPLPAAVSQILIELTRAKLTLAREPRPRPALFRLHVLEADSLEVTSHAVPRNPECSVCGNR